MKSLRLSYNSLPEFSGVAEELRYSIYCRAQRKLRKRDVRYRGVYVGYAVLVVLLSLPQWGFTFGHGGFQAAWFVAWLVGYLAFVIWGAFYLQTLSLELARPYIRRMVQLLKARHELD